MALALTLAAPAQAHWWWHDDGSTQPPQPDGMGCSTITEPQFGAYTVQKCYEVWRDTNPGNPLPVPGNVTFVYTLQNDAASYTSIVQFSIQAPAATGGVTQATAIAGEATDAMPSSVDASVPGQVTFDFASPAIDPGQMSAPLVIVSPFGPGAVTDNMVTIKDALNLTTASTCVGPSTLPNPVPCSPFFWGLRSIDSFFVKKYFPGSQFDQVADFAAANSSVFATASDVKHALFPGFIITPAEAAKVELSALLLNIGAGELFPANTKCRVFFDTGIDMDGDGVADTTVGEQLVTIESDILAGDLSSLFEARALADSINDGRGLIDSTQF